MKSFGSTRRPIWYDPTAMLALLIEVLRDLTILGAVALAVGGATAVADTIGDAIKKVADTISDAIRKY